MSVCIVPAACEGSAQTGTARSCETGSSCGPNEACTEGRCVPKSGSDASAPESGAAPDSGAGPQDITGFCDSWLDAFASYMERCGCGAETIQHYRDQSAALCGPSGFFVAVSDAIAAGDIVYHPEAVSALLSRLKDNGPLCVEESFRALKLDSSELYSFAGVFTGTHEIGTPCAHPVSFKGGFNDCREGVCAPNASGTGGVCIALVAVGEACDASGDHNLLSTTKRLCFDRRMADIDGEYESAFDSVSCIPTAPGSATKVCAADLADGQPCDSDEACRSARCLGTGVVHEAYCAAKLTDGQPCTSHGDCTSGACHSGATPVCGAPLADGEECFSSNEACASGSCNDAVSTGFCGPPPSKAIGAACTSAAECITSGHGGSRDKVCAGGACIADICASYL
jgi:hypothetical protein